MRKHNRMLGYPTYISTSQTSPGRRTKSNQSWGDDRSTWQKLRKPPGITCLCPSAPDDSCPCHSRPNSLYCSAAAPRSWHPDLPSRGTDGIWHCFFYPLKRTWRKALASSAYSPHFSHVAGENDSRHLTCPTPVEGHVEGQQDCPSAAQSMMWLSRTQMHTHNTSTVCAKRRREAHCQEWKLPWINESTLSWSQTCRGLFQIKWCRDSHLTFKSVLTCTCHAFGKTCLGFGWNQYKIVWCWCISFITQEI